MCVECCLVPETIASTKPCRQGHGTVPISIKATTYLPVLKTCLYAPTRTKLRCRLADHDNEYRTTTTLSSQVHRCLHPCLQTYDQSSLFLYARSIRNLCTSVSFVHKVSGASRVFVCLSWLWVCLRLPVWMDTYGLGKTTW